MRHRIRARKTARAAWILAWVLSLLALYGAITGDLADAYPSLRVLLAAATFALSLVGALALVLWLTRGKGERR